MILFDTGDANINTKSCVLHAILTFHELFYGTKYIFWVNISKIKMCKINACIQASVVGLKAKRRLF